MTDHPYRVFRVVCERTDKEGRDIWMLGNYSRDAAEAWLRKALGKRLIRILPIRRKSRR